MCLAEGPAICTGGQGSWLIKKYSYVSSLLQLQHGHKMKKCIIRETK